jgi:hypothetical protein
LVIEHCVHEARGLDVLPGTIAKFRNNGDEASAELLEKTSKGLSQSPRSAPLMIAYYLCPDCLSIHRDIQD